MQPPCTCDPCPLTPKAREHQPPKSSRDQTDQQFTDMPLPKGYLSAKQVQAGPRLTTGWCLFDKPIWMLSHPDAREDSGH